LIFFVHTFDTLCPQNDHRHYWL